MMVNKEFVVAHSTERLFVYYFQIELCSSRKCPYLPTEAIFSNTPPHPSGKSN